MPNHKRHLNGQKNYLPKMCAKTGRRWSGRTYEWVDKWIDAGINAFGIFHRIVRHQPHVPQLIYHMCLNAGNTVEYAWEASLAARLHLALDYMERIIKKQAMQWGRAVVSAKQEMWDEYT